MKLELDDDELDRLTDLLFERLSARFSAERQPASEFLSTKLFYTEPEAADMLGISSWTLKRARLNGEIKATACGARLIRYSREQVEDARDWLSTRAGSSRCA